MSQLVYKPLLYVLYVFYAFIILNSSYLVILVICCRLLSQNREPKYKYFVLHALLE